MGEADTMRGEVDPASTELFARDRNSRLHESAFDSIAQQLVQRLHERLHGRIEADTVAPMPSDEELGAFCEALVSADRDRSRGFFEDLRARGVTPDTLALRYIAPAARRLGEFWTADICGFLEVTLGCARLHALQRSLRNDFAAGVANPPSALSAMFAPIPGETHVLGVRMAADFFRRAGWNVDFRQPRDVDELSSYANESDFNLIGISAACMSVLPQLHSTVELVRRVRPDAVLVLGGNIVELEPQIAQQVDIDHTLTNVTTAPLILQREVYNRLSP